MGLLYVKLYMIVLGNHSMRLGDIVEIYLYCSLSCLEIGDSGGLFFVNLELEEVCRYQ